MRPLSLDRLPSQGHAIIEASAGTGKTYAIEHLIVDLLRSAAKTIEEILVVTFTEKATAELRARIRSLIENIVRGEPAGRSPAKTGHAWTPIEEAAHQRLEQALAAFERAPIFTIHGFCHRVLTEFAFHSGARFELDLVDGRRAFRSAFRAELRERFAVDDLLRHTLAEWLEQNSADGLENLLFTAHHSRYCARDHAGAIEEARQAAAAKQKIAQQLLIDLYLPLVEERLDRDKREHGHLDYDDMLAWVWRALEGPGGAALAAVLRQRYRFGLVDEFQDTDDLQWQIFKRIFVDGKDGNRLFVVGDPKQAIYAFRNADVHSYMRAREELRATGAPLLPIDMNFRSTADLIEACNHILDQNAKKPLFTGAIVYDRPVKCGMRERIALDARGRTIVPITLMRYGPAAGDKGSAEDARQQLGRFIAATIKRMIDGAADSIGIEEPDRKSGKTARRRVAARDIFVLTQTNNECQKIGEYLREAAVPFAFYKLDGLFQTNEAIDVLDVLRAIEDLNDHSRRLRAWMSPFFGLKFREVAAIADLPLSHPLNERLYEWRVLAEAERFADLFNRLLHESGLADRELFLRQSERELTNYFHIFEALLERAVAERLSFAEIVDLLDDYRNGRAEPPGPDGNVQRLESERAAVQVMTVHMSKGLEADVVILFGGLNRTTKPAQLRIYHEGYERRFAIGAEAQKEEKDALDRERNEEDQRLLYVAMTRARAKLFLPYFPTGSIRAPNGYYKPLNERLKDVVKTFSGSTADNGRMAKLIEIADACNPITAPETQRETVPIDKWTPPAELLKDKSELETVFDRLRNDHAAFRMSSYTSLRHAQAAWDLTPVDFKEDVATPIETEDLPGGSDVGIFLHEVIEKLDFESLATAADLESWQRLAYVERLFRESMQRHGVRDPRWFNRGTEMVFRALTSPIAITDGRMIGPFAKCRNTREMEFVFPIPETSHPGPGSAIAEGWAAERGFLKGFIDFVFEDKGLTYFADWKSDLLHAYDANSIEQHVRRNYELQALIYSVGVIRLLRIRSEEEYERRFGGLLYVFLRGACTEADPSRGIYFQRPAWSEILRHERDLIKLGEQA